ncbi:MAG: glycosyltransferase family 4 protein [Prevotellaceae bacterium]|jgi:glycosyltransferase involved in cell wall biosynthesis|nr:glycosyltransferase family 4 protein [Prevotellaceae bacterium]
MNILILSTFEKTGGAAIAANRLLQALNKAGHDAKMLVRDKQTDDPNVVSTNTSWGKRKLNFLRFVCERLVIFISNRFNRKDLFVVSLACTGANISKHPLVRNVDIIHIHWINQGFLSLKNIKQLINTGKPVVWTMHDFWACGGICHIVANSATCPETAGACNRFTAKCGYCPFLQSRSKRDLSNRIFRQKQRLFNNSDIRFVGCSRWVANMAKESALLRDASVINIPNPIDTETFKPYNKSEMRKKFRLPFDKKLLIFASAKVSDERKGILYLLEACKRLTNNNIEVVIIGGKIDDSQLNDIPLKINKLGYLDVADDIASAYAACDVFVTPSLADNLPNTVMEAMACGIPCVGFNTGGIPEMIDHKENGYVAQYQNAEDLAHGICWTVFETDYEQLSQNARKKVMDCYSETVVAQKYTELYKTLN